MNQIAPSVKLMLAVPVTDWNDVEQWLRDTDDLFASWLDGGFAQIGTLIVSAAIGGVISYWITKRSNDRVRVVQEMRDQRRNIFESRKLRNQLSLQAGHNKWQVWVDTIARDRRHWVMTATPPSGERLVSATFYLFSLDSNVDDHFLTGNDESDNKKYPASGIRWSADHGQWEPDGTLHDTIFSFDIKGIIDGADCLRIMYETGNDGETSSHQEEHYLSPFDTMKDYRPWSS